MNEEELRTEVAKRREVSDPAWECMRDLGFIDEALWGAGEAEDDPVGYIVEKYDRLARGFSASPIRRGGPGRTGQEYYWALNDHERERAEVKAQALAKHASADARVQAFRDRFLGGELLSPEEARAFVSSLADENHARSEEYGSVMLSVVGDLSDIIRNWPFHVSLPTPEEVKKESYGGIPDFGYWRGFTGYVRADSPLGALRDLGDYLAERYQGWESEYATRFVLTGDAPKIQPLVVERPLAIEGQSTTITMHVESWISAASVQDAYRGALQSRARLSERYSSGRMSQWNRRISDKNLKLLRFVTQRLDSRGRRPEDSKVLVAEWDAQEWVQEWDAQEHVLENRRRRASYRGNTRRFWRDYNRALRQVAPEAARTGR